MHKNTNISQKSEKANWIKLKCPQCHLGKIYILSSWTNTPRFCDLCKARRVDKKERGLRVYIKQFKQNKKDSEENKNELEIILKIEQRLDQLKEIHGENERIIFEELIKIKKVRDILFSWDKNLRRARLNSKHHKTDAGLSPNKNFTGFVQGGAPGLKK